jgi:SAM-dependent methyltransferase
MEVIEVTRCPLCKSSKSSVFDRRVLKNFPVENRLCSRCGFVYQSPRMSDESLEAFYTGDYRRAYQDQEGPTPKDIFIQENRARYLVRYIQRYLKSEINPAFHLDIGSSSGALLEQFEQSLNIKGVGIEPGDAYRAYAQRRGLEVHPSLEHLGAKNQRRFGLVSLVHVLEHFANPVDYLVQLRTNVLADGGSLLVEVPNLYAHDCFEVAHLVSFSPHALKETLRVAGFSLIVLRAHGEPRSKLLPLYLSALASPHPAGIEVGAGADNVRPEMGVKIKRQSGMLVRRFLERFANRWAWLPLPKSVL